jgi:prepilin-type N-terminal cleavage/methylation domain-containing protein
VRSQGGYTLIELLVASAIGVIVMSGLTSVVLTTVRAGGTATSRIEASSQIRSFQLDAYDDFALSGVPTLTSCAPSNPPPCTIVLSGQLASNALVPVASNYQVTYTWDGVNVDRQAGTSPSRHAATGVTAFSAAIVGTYPNQTVDVTMTVTVQAYSETQSLRFYPRVNP